MKSFCSGLIPLIGTGISFCLNRKTIIIIYLGSLVMSLITNSPVFDHNIVYYIQYIIFCMFYKSLSPSHWAWIKKLKNSFHKTSQTKVWIINNLSTLYFYAFLIIICKSYFWILVLDLNNSTFTNSKYVFYMFIIYIYIICWKYVY